MAPKIEDLTGKRFGRLVVLNQNGFKYKPSGQRNVLWHCKCDCGNEKDIPANSLRNGRSKSCGCYSSEYSSARATKHGGCKGNSFEPTYRVWCSIKSRCYSKSNNRYNNYGGRGIRICDEWLDYENFRTWAIQSGYKNGLSIDRINVNGNYEPSNCRWATAKEQANNTTRNMKIKAFGRIQTLQEWSDETGIPSETIRLRICKIGMEPECALKKCDYRSRQKA